MPPGTNGGVTATGLLAGVLGAFTIAVTSAILIPFCSGEASGLLSRVQWVLAVTVWGALGSVLDSILGGLFQASVVDKRSGKIVEGTGGGKVCPADVIALQMSNEMQVLVHPASARPGSTAQVSGFSRSSDGSVHLRNTEEIANAAALKGTRATGTSRGTSPGRATEPHHESRRVESGWDVLDNNAVNVLMAFLMSVGGMLVACWAWGFSISDIGRSVGVF